ncbi:hypothetical protein [Salinigranum sp. GCM10025319]|uniref:hypothetical protein n=1 Tax=Salinigranum sp. GCM10025319 TaxID=3252687 RepID=UPI00361E2F97
MGDVRQLYHRLDDWVRDRSRPEYALLVGSASAVAVFATGVVMGEAMAFEAAAMGVSMAVFHYAFNPHHER